MKKLKRRLTAARLRKKTSVTAGTLDKIAHDIYCQYSGIGRQGEALRGAKKISGSGAYARLKACYRYCKQWNSFAPEPVAFIRKRPLTGRWYCVPPPGRPARDSTLCSFSYFTSFQVTSTSSVTSTPCTPW